MPRKRKMGPTRQIAAKDRWRCTVCQKWKFTSAYTAKELNKVTKDVDLQPDNCFMTCQDCADEPELYQCEGDCGEMKPAEAFSKVSRKDGTWKCMKCVSWDGLQEAYVPPLEPEHLLTMTLVVDAATAMAGSYFDEPASHPEDSSWALAMASAASAAGIDVSDKSSGAVHTARSPSPVPVDRGLRYNAYDDRGDLHAAWQAMTGEDSTTTRASTRSTSQSTSRRSNRAWVRGAYPMHDSYEVTQSTTSQASKPTSQRSGPPRTTSSFNTWVESNEGPWRATQASGSTSQRSETDFPGLGASGSSSVAVSDKSNNEQSRWAQALLDGDMMMDG